MTQRLQRHPYLALFDGPDTNTSTDVRSSATVPLQALFWMNSPFVREQAEGFADRLVREAPDLRQRIERAHRVAWSRPPTCAESQAGQRYVDRFASESRRLGASSSQAERDAWTSYAKIMLSANDFIYVE
jgi:hypothetical protein